MLSRYNFPEEYIEHDYRKHKEFLPYTRWIEMIEIIYLKEQEEQYLKWELAAFQSWNGLIQNWGSKKTPPDFETYKRQMGIKRPKFAGKSKKAEIEKSDQAIKDLGFGSLMDLLKPKAT